jgi:hypothetical protein
MSAMTFELSAVFCDTMAFKESENPACPKKIPGKKHMKIKENKRIGSVDESKYK